MNKEEAQKLVPGNRITFRDSYSRWEVMKIVERGVVLQLATTGAHMHLCEWSVLEERSAKLAYNGIPPVFTEQEQQFLDNFGS